MSVIKKLLLLACAGGIGTLSRFGLTSFVKHISKYEIAVGTLVVNLLGAFLVGLLWAVAEKGLQFNDEIRFYIFVGFFGAFTTFSTFMLESVSLFQNTHSIYAIGNLLVQNAAGIGLVMAGLYIGNIIAR